MVVDDDDSILEVMKLMLEMNDYEVITAIDGRVLEDFQENLPDLLLLDIWMSGVDGRVICKKLKTNDRTKNLPVVMVSASRDVQLDAQKAGADGFITKPFDMDYLLTYIEKILNKC